MPLFLEKKAFKNLLSICFGESGTCGGPGDPGVRAGAHKDVCKKKEEVRDDGRHCTPDEARAKRKAYRKRKAAKAARRRNRR